jgi:hypothetical protein
MDYTTVKTVLYGHTSPATAYVVDDYPYGRTLRCKIRYWLENHPKRGARFVHQTTNPKVESREFWNKPHKSTYADIGAVLYLDDKGHVQWTALKTWAKPSEVREFMTTFPGVDVEGINLLIRANLPYVTATSEGRHTHTMNGKPIMPDEHEIEKAKRELDEWRAILRDMMGRMLPTEAPAETPTA